MRGPWKCPCCGEVESTSGCLRGPTCRCTQFQYCYGCHKCDRHCDCHEGPTRDFEEAERRWKARSTREVSDGRSLV